MLSCSMDRISLASALVSALTLTFVTASVGSSLDHIQPRINGHSAAEARGISFRRSLAAAAIENRDVDTLLKNSTKLSKSFNGATLFHASKSKDSSGGDSEKLTTKNSSTVSADILVVCSTCYLSGTATAELIVDGDFNATEALQSLEDEFSEEISNLTSTAIDQIEATAKNDAEDILTWNIDDLQWPTIDLDFDLAIPGIPQCQVLFQFDGLELYMELDTILSGAASYTLNLYTSDTPLGIKVSNDLDLGILFTVDLILSVDAEIDISTGFHLKLADGTAFSLDMFGKNISSITFNGGQFEFLPVTVASAGAVLSAVLRVGAHAGFQTGEPGFDVLGHTVGSFSTGIEAGAFANIAELTTNISAGADDCYLEAVEAYRLVVGAAAGATLAIDDHTWGPVPNTTVPIWYTTLGAQCATSRAVTTTASATASATATVAARAALVVPRQESSTSLTEATVTTTVTNTGIGCLSTGLVNCPISLQTTSITSYESTIVTSVPSGVVASWPATTDTAVALSPFGNAIEMEATSGTPSPFTPKATGNFSKHAGGLTNREKHIIIGVTVGVGGALLIAIGVAVFFIMKRRKTHSRAKNEVSQVHETQQFLETDANNVGSGHDVKDKVQTDVTVTRA